jgi:hypothetical protein
VPGYSVYATYQTGPLYDRVGYAAAIERFAADDLDTEEQYGPAVAAPPACSRQPLPLRRMRRPVA